MFIFIFIIWFYITFNFHIAISEILIFTLMYVFLFIILNCLYFNQVAQHFLPINIFPKIRPLISNRYRLWFRNYMYTSITSISITPFLPLLWKFHFLLYCTWFQMSIWILVQMEFSLFRSLNCLKCLVTIKNWNYTNKLLHMYK